MGTGQFCELNTSLWTGFDQFYSQRSVVHVAWSHSQTQNIYCVGQNGLVSVNMCKIVCVCVCVCVCGCVCVRFGVCGVCRLTYSVWNQHQVASTILNTFPFLVYTYTLTYYEHASVLHCIYIA